MKLLFGCLAGASVAVGSWGCATSSSDASSHGPTFGADGGGSDAVVMVDASNDVVSSPAEASDDDATGSDTDACAGAVAIVGGTVAGASTIAFGATLLHGGAWAVSSLPTNVASPPAIVAYGGGFIAAFVDASGDLQYATSTWTWSSPAGVASLAAKGSPSLAVIGTSLHLVYQGEDGSYFHGIYTSGSGWDAASDPVGGAKQGFGPSPPVAESVAGALVIAYGGQNGSLYDETWTAGAWAPDNQHAMADVRQLSPAIVALTGGASDTLVVYAGQGGTLYSTARSGGTWSAPAAINANAFTSTAPTLAPLAAGRALMAYLGNDQLPYFSVYDPSTTPPWTGPAAIGANSPKLASPPALAPGVCGDDAVAALTEPSGVAAARYVGGVWLAPTVLPGTVGMTFAAVASQP